MDTFIHMVVTFHIQYVGHIDHVLHLCNLHMSCVRVHVRVRVRVRVRVCQRVSVCVCGCPYVYVCVRVCQARQGYREFTDTLCLQNKTKQSSKFTDMLC